MAKAQTFRLTQGSLCPSFVLRHSPRRIVMTAGPASSTRTGMPCLDIVVTVLLSAEELYSLGNGNVSVLLDIADCEYRLECASSLVLRHWAHAIPLLHGQKQGGPLFNKWRCLTFGGAGHESEVVSPANCIDRDDRP